MPVYEYLCDSEEGGCGHRFEEQQSFADEALTKCPGCKKKKLRRVYGTPALLFIGSGWVPSANGTDFSPRK